MRARGIINYITYIVAFVLLAGFVFLSAKVFVTDSEFWSISLGYHFADDFKNSWVYVRPLYYFLIWLTQLSYTSPTESVLLARGLFTVNALFIAYFLMRIMKRHTGSFLYPAISIVLLFGNTGFLNQGFRIRSDLLAASLSLWVLTLIPFQKSQYKYLIFAPLLATPKALLHSVILMSSYPQQILSKNLRKIIPLVLIVILILFLNKDSLGYFLNTFTGQWGGPTYGSQESFFHIFNQIKRNPIFWIFVLLRFYTYHKCSKENAPRQSEDAYLIRTTVVAFILMLVSTEKVQFFIASFLPYFAIHAAMLIYDLHKMKWNRIKNSLLAIAAGSSLLTGIWWIQVNGTENNNDQQLRTLDGVYSQLKRAQVRSVEDFTCLLPPYCTHRHFVGPNQPEANKSARNKFFQDPTEVFFYLKKAQFLEPELSAFLAQNYHNTNKGIFLRKDQLPQNQTGADISLQSTGKQSEEILGLEKQLSGYLEYLFGYDIEY